MLEPLPAARSEYFYDEAHGDSDEPVYFDEDDPIQVEAAAAGAIAAPNPFVGIGPRTVVRSFAVWGAALAGHPMRLAGQAARLATDSLTALSGPPPGTVDRRFAHPAWQNVLPYRLLAREYLVLRDAIYESVERSGLKGDDAERARFAAALLAEALAPTNNLLLNPAGAERLWRTRGHVVAARRDQPARRPADQRGHAGGQPARRVHRRPRSGRDAGTGRSTGPTSAS